MNKDDLIQLVESAMSTRDIATNLSLSQTTVRYWLKKYKLKTSKLPNNKIKNCKNCGDTCNNCGDTLSCRNKKYCSNKCQGEHQWMLKKISIENGTAKLVAPPTWKRYLIEIRGHACEKCHNTEWMGEKIPLTSDHIDGDADNNVPSNFRLLCPNCHTQTPTFAGKNKGRGKRNYRQAIYKKNKELGKSGRIYN